MMIGSIVNFRVCSFCQIIINLIVFYGKIKSMLKDASINSVHIFLL